MKIALFISGRGSLIPAFHNEFGADLALVVASGECAGIEVAKQLGISVITSLPDNSLLAMLSELGVEMICLAGYLKVIPEDFLEKFSGIVLNSHPSLIPKYCGHGFYGKKVHKAVIENGDSESGFTIHQVTAVVDAGPIEYQGFVVVDQDETAESLAEKILDQEKVWYPRVAMKMGAE